MLTEIELSITVTPTDESCGDYSYEITTGMGQISISYNENSVCDTATSEIFFGSIKEMEAVALAMLKACEIYKVK